MRSQTREAGSETGEAAPLSESRRSAGVAPGLRAATHQSPPTSDQAKSFRFPLPASHIQLPLTELQLTDIWRGRRYPAGALVTRGGVPVNVIFQGRPGRGPGPDFRGAVIAGPSGVPVKGDVELHVRASSFRAHGHHLDPAYAGVILHVVFEDDLGADTQLPGGGSSPVVALAPWVARRADELRRWLDRPLLWREPCHDAVMRLGVGRAGAALDAEGDRRFEARVARARDAARAGGAEQALYEGLLEALGYAGNGPPMLALARRLPWRELVLRAGGGASRAFDLEALLLGAAALLPSQRGHRGPIDDYAAALDARFALERLPSLPSGSWRLWGIRPANAPARRVAAAAALLARLAAPSDLLRIVDARTVNEAIAPLLVEARGYWTRRHDPCAAPCRLPPSLAGRSRALEIIVNVVLPVACATGDGGLATRARALFARLPRPAVYGRTRFIENALASEGLRVPVNARRAQGLLALHATWCSANGCGRCPLS